MLDLSSGELLRLEWSVRRHELLCIGNVLLAWIHIVLELPRRLFVGIELIKLLELCARHVPVDRGSGSVLKLFGWKLLCL